MYVNFAFFLVLHDYISVLMPSIHHYYLNDCVLLISIKKTYLLSIPFFGHLGCLITFHLEQ